MKYIFSAIVFLHAIIHLTGFLKAFGLARIDQLSSDIPKISGIFWLLTSVLFLVSVITFIAKADFWYIPALIAVLISFVLIIGAWHDAKYGTLANLIILAIVIVSFGTSTFHNKYRNDVKAGLSTTADLPVSVLTEADIEYLPEPVKKYIRSSGSIGKPKVNNFRIEFKGQIRQNEQSEWMPFTTVQYNFMETTSRFFFMKAVMKKLPVAGYHRFSNGKAYMDIRLFSLLRVQYLSGPEADISETVTFFNDMCCMAPATLTDKRIKWLETCDNKVRAEFTSNNITISAWLYFNDKGELINFISDDRYAMVDNNTVLRLRWSTPLRDVSDIDGFNLAKSAETIYSYPEGDFCYGTFNLIHVESNCKEIK
jgi:hypothetical protein